MTPTGLFLELRCEDIMRAKTMTILVALVVGSAVLSTSMILASESNRVNNGIDSQSGSRGIDHRNQAVIDKRQGMWRFSAGPKHPIY
jgi:hypothetical protein